MPDRALEVLAKARAVPTERETNTQEATTTEQLPTTDTPTDGAPSA